MMRQNDKKLGRWSVRMDKIELPSLWKYFVKPNVWDHFRYNLYHPSDLWVKYLFVKIWSKFVWFYGEVCKCLSFKGKNRNLKQICVVVYGEVCKCLSFKAQTFTYFPIYNHTNLLQISVFSFKAQTFTYFPIEPHKFASNFDKKILHS